MRIFGLTFVLCLLKLADENGFKLLTSYITRVDRNSPGSYIDLVLVNEDLYGGMTEVIIDKKDSYKPANYEGRS